MIGLKRGTAALYDHEEEWETEAERTVSKLRDILGDATEDIQHIGSTAIPAIKAKPIIDIAVAAYSFDSILAKKAEMEANGFYLRRWEDHDEQLLFACGSYYDGSGEIQTHFIHVVKKDSMDWINYINFRDYMNSNLSAAKEYEALKLSLAEKAPENGGREKYTVGKHEFITYTLRKALVRSYLGKTVRIEIDRPVGYIHKKEKYSLLYNINYGYIPGVIGGDGEELDVYLLGVDTPVSEYTCRIVGIVHRKNDVEDKLIAAPEGIFPTREEMESAVYFQEQYYDTVIETANLKRPPYYLRV